MVALAGLGTRPVADTFGLAKLSLFFSVVDKFTAKLGTGSRGLVCDGVGEGSSWDSRIILRPPDVTEYDI